MKRGSHIALHQRQNKPPLEAPLTCCEGRRLLNSAHVSTAMRGVTAAMTWAAKLGGDKPMAVMRMTCTAGAAGPEKQFNRQAD